MKKYYVVDEKLVVVKSEIEKGKNIPKVKGMKLAFFYFVFSCRDPPLFNLNKKTN